jgi:hypothetical protein
MQPNKPTTKTQMETTTERAKRAKSEVTKHEVSKIKEEKEKNQTERSI